MAWSKVLRSSLGLALVVGLFSVASSGTAMADTVSAAGAWSPSSTITTGAWLSNGSWGMGTFSFGNVSYDPAELNTLTADSWYVPPYGSAPLYQASFTFTYTAPSDVYGGYVYDGALCANGTYSWLVPSIGGVGPAAEMPLYNYPLGTVHSATVTPACPEGAGKVVGFAVEGTGVPGCFWGSCGASPDPSNVLTWMFGPSDTIIDGYDLDEMAQAIEDNGGWPDLIALGAVVAPAPTPSNSSLRQGGEAMAEAERSGKTIKQALVILAVLTVGGLSTIAYYIWHGTSRGSSVPSNPPAPSPPHNPTGNPAPGSHGRGTPGGPVSGGSGVGTKEIELVVQNWQQRITAGHIGASTRDKTQITTDVLKTAAKQCLQLAAAAAALGGVDFSSGNPCLDERILFPAGGDAQAAARHDLDAMAAGHPEWVQLNYMSGVNKDPQVPAGWYTRQPYWSVSGCKQAAKPGIQCDEYPLYATTQGGPTAMGGDGASLRPIDKTQNEAEGRAYGAMVTTGFCDMQSAPAVPRGTRATGGTPFLVVPLPDVPVPSFFLC